MCFPPSPTVFPSCGGRLTWRPPLLADLLELPSEERSSGSESLRVQTENDRRKRTDARASNLRIWEDLRGFSHLHTREKAK